MNPSFKTVARRLFPPLVWDAFRALRHTRPLPVPPRSYIWNGVFQTFGEIPASGSGHDDPEWVNRYYADMQQVRAAYASGGKVAPSSYGEHYLLCLLAAQRGIGQDELRILDFGGGLGPGYLHLTQTLVAPPRLHYTVIDTAPMCEKGCKFFAGDEQIRFMTSIPEKPGALDIVYLNSVLQYIEDYEQLLGRLCGCDPAFILLTRLNAGNNPRFVAAQENLPNSVIPNWFFNAGEIIQLISSHGYRLVYNGMTAWNYDLSNYRPEYRIPGSLNLLFSRTPPR